MGGKRCGKLNSVLSAINEVDTSPSVVGGGDSVVGGVEDERVPGDHAKPVTGPLSTGASVTAELQRICRGSSRNLVSVFVVRANRG